MRISDWSSDVCSPDLARQLRVDHAERVEAEARRDGEFDKGAALELGRMLERSPVVDHDHPRPCTAKRRAQLLERDRLSRSRLADDRAIVIAGGAFDRDHKRVVQGKTG